MMIVCTKCGQFFHPKKNGVTVEEGMPATVNDKRGQGNWRPYKLWKADLLQCLGCGDEIIAGFAQSPFSEHYKEDYASRKATNPPHIFVKDCI